MLMAAAVRMDNSTHPSSSAAGSPPPWHNPALPVPTHHHQHHSTVLFDPADLSTPFPSPSPPQTPRNHHQKLRPGAARGPSSSRRRPRPSRKVPTTYITADPASFRRMVHQVTGADDLPPLARPTPPHETTTLCRPLPSRAAASSALTTMLPTLDTSALLLGIGGSGSGTARRTTTGPAAASSVRPGPALEADVGAGAGVGVGVGLGGAGYGGSDCGAGASAGGFPTLESWDALLY